MFCITRKDLSMEEKIKVGFCVAYDWYLLRHALPCVYQYADIICLSLDVNRISWSGNSYPFDEIEFFKLVKQLDNKNKVIILADDYHLTNLSPMENEVRQRNHIAKKMGAGGWHIQLDCDEYFVDFGSFVKYLHRVPSYSGTKLNVCCPLLVLFKKVEQGFLYVNPVDLKRIEYIQIATQEPHYEYGRRNGNFNIYTNSLIVHQSWARDAHEVREKILNWGHSNDFDREKYFLFWMNLNKTNFMNESDFHWLKPEAWPKLTYFAANSIEELLSKSGSLDFPKVSSLSLLFKNSKTISRLKKLSKLLFSNP